MGDNDSMKDVDLEGSPSSLKPAQQALDDEHDIIIKKYTEACQAGDMVTVKELVESGAVTLGEDLDENNVSGLHWAAINNRLGIAKYLVEAGATVDRKGGDLEATPLHWACRYGLVYIVDYLLKQGADPLQTDSQGFNCLHLAVHSSNIMLVVYLLIFAPQIPVDSTGPNERTALHWAAYQGDSLSVDALLKFNASVRAVDDQGFTPLHWALLRGQQYLLKRLLEEGSDIQQQTNDGKNGFVIASDMSTTAALNQALYEAGFDSTGLPIKKYFSSKNAKLITYFTPFILVGLFLGLFATTNIIIAILITVLTGFLATKVLSKVVYPSYILSSDPLLRTPFYAGVFSGISFWTIVSWFFVLIPTTIKEEFVLNFLFALTTIIVFYCFFTTMFADPGIINPSSSVEDMKADIEDLLQVGHYDAKHFCIYTLVKKPLRSKYSSFYERCVARFDHYCPWAFNVIGLKNHKSFMFFVVSLQIAMTIFIFLAHEYFDELDNDDDLKCLVLSEDLCAGLNNSPFVFMNYLFVCFNYIWVNILLFSQLFQISKGVTTTELAAVSSGAISDPNRNVYYSSAPSEFLDESDNSANASRIAGTRQKTCCSVFCVVTGLGQFIIAIKQFFGSSNDRNSFNEIPTDYGLLRNCMDFWISVNPENELSWTAKLQSIFKISTTTNAEAYLNGIKVDYFHLYKLPEKRPAYVAAPTV